MKTVYHNGCGLLVSDTVLEAYGLRNGQNVDEAMIWSLISANAAEFSASMKLMRVRGLDAPDCAKIDEILDSLPRPLV